MAYGMDFKKRAVAYKQEGHTFKQLREAFGIPSETYYQWEKKLKNGYYEIKTERTRNRKIDKEDLKRSVALKPDAYLYESAQKYDCTDSAVFYALKKLKITLKKRLSPTVKNLRRNGANTL
jgi:transposase